MQHFKAETSVTSHPAVVFCSEEHNSEQKMMICYSTRIPYSVFMVVVPLPFSVEFLRLILKLLILKQHV